MQTYLNDPTLKARFLAEIAAHEAQDALVQGIYSEVTGGQFRGCAIGCALHSMNVLQGKTGDDAFARTDAHDRYPDELGLPTWFAYLEDKIFEGLPIALARTWPRRIADAIPVGAVVDDIVLAKILRWSLADPDYGVRYATDDDEIRGHIDVIIALFDAEIATGGQAPAEQRQAAARAAWAARDAWAAWAARDAWDAWAARDAWDAWAAWAARDAWAAWAVEQPEVKKADAFFPALSEYVLAVVRELPGHDPKEAA